MTHCCDRLQKAHATCCTVDVTEGVCICSRVHSSKTALACTGNRANWVSLTQSNGYVLRLLDICK